MQTLVVPIVPELPRLLNAPVSDTAWAVRDAARRRRRHPDDGSARRHVRQAADAAAEAVVIVTDVRGGVLATAHTDVLGEFTVTDLVPGPVPLAVNSPKHRPLARVVEIGAAGTTRVELELRPGAQVRGTVRAGSAPLSDARVTLVDAAGNVVATAWTGVDGAYAFSDLDTGAYTVIATGYPPQAASVTVSGTGVDDHDIELAHAGE